MKAHVEILIRLNLNKGETLHDVLRQFCREPAGWLFPERDSEICQHHTANAGGYVICDSIKGLERSIVALAAAQSKRPQTFCVANIVPRNSELTIERYNAIGMAFARAFGKWLKTSAFEGSVRCSGARKALADIIPAKKCRTHFERYLKCPSWDPSSLRSHPSDIGKLDVFICALYRYGAEVDLYEIERFLVTDQNWKRTDAAWVRRRIETGLEVLRIDRRF